MTERDDAHQLSGAYALHAVDDQEAALVEAAMEESEDFRSEVVGLSDTAVALGMALPVQTPPSALRSRLLDAIESTPQLSAEDERVTSAMPVASAMPPGDHVVTKRRSRRRMRPMAWLAVGAAAVVLFGGGFFVQRTLLEPQREVAAVIAAPDSVKAVADITGGGKATVYWSKTEHRTAVMLTGVTPPSGKVLQLWSVHHGVAVSAGLYDSNDATLIAGTPSAGETLAVTVEPDGGSPKPTTQPIVKVPLSA
jgi:anti-sigma-K factor RskA